MQDQVLPGARFFPKQLFFTLFRSVLYLHMLLLLGIACFFAA